MPRKTHGAPQHDFSIIRRALTISSLKLCILAALLEPKKNYRKSQKSLYTGLRRSARILFNKQSVYTLAQSASFLLIKLKTHVLLLAEEIYSKYTFDVGRRYHRRIAHCRIPSIFRISSAFSFFLFSFLIKRKKEIIIEFL